jgi:hypothetical protein
MRQEEPQSPSFIDHGSHIEVALPARDFVAADLSDALAAATNRFGRKPMLVICDDPAESVDMTRAYNVGVNLSMQMPFRRIAIVLTGRRSTGADRFTELVAENRGAEVRFFEDIHLARMWLTQGAEQGKNRTDTP